MQIVDMRRSDREGNIKAFFRVQTDEGFVIEGFKIMNGKNGLFASMPSKKVGEKFIETVTGSRELKNELGRVALAEYNALPADGRPVSNPDPGPDQQNYGTDLPF
jgi:stage V sporulation protein G